MNINAFCDLWKKNIIKKYIPSSKRQTHCRRAVWRSATRWGAQSCPYRNRTCLPGVDATPGRPPPPHCWFWCMPLQRWICWNVTRDRKSSNIGLSRENQENSQTFLRKKERKTIKLRNHHKIHIISQWTCRTQLLQGGGKANLPSPIIVVGQIARESRLRVAFSEFSLSHFYKVSDFPAKFRSIPSISLNKNLQLNGICQGKQSLYKNVSKKSLKAGRRRDSWTIPRTAMLAIICLKINDNFFWRTMQTERSDGNTELEDSEHCQWDCCDAHGKNFHRLIAGFMEGRDHTPQQAPTRPLKGSKGLDSAPQRIRPEPTESRYEIKKI